MSAVGSAVIVLVATAVAIDPPLLWDERGPVVGVIAVLAASVSVGIAIFADRIPSGWPGWQSARDALASMCWAALFALLLSLMFAHSSDLSLAGCFLSAGAVIVLEGALVWSLRRRAIHDLEFEWRASRGAPGRCRWRLDLFLPAVLPVWIVTGAESGVLPADAADVASLAAGVFASLWFLDLYKQWQAARLRTD